MADKRRNPAETSPRMVSFVLERNGSADGKQPRRAAERRVELAALFVLLLLAGALLRVGYRQYMRAAYPLAYSDYVEKYAKVYEFEPSLIYALIRTESEFDPDAISSAHAMGLMQLTADTFQWAQSRSPETESRCSASASECSCCSSAAMSTESMPGSGFCPAASSRSPGLLRADIRSRIWDGMRSRSAEIIRFCAR